MSVAVACCVLRLGFWGWVLVWGKTVHGTSEKVNVGSWFEIKKHKSVEINCKAESRQETSQVSQGK
jgi:hypothetical protein